jgi:hypothetical protein
MKVEYKAVDGAAQEAAVNPEVALEVSGDDAADETGIVPFGHTEVGGVTGDLSASDIPTPWLKIAYGVGGLSANFNPGSLVLDDTVLLAERGAPVKAIILTANLYWKEYLSREDRDSNVMPRRFQSEDQVHAAGGTTEWVNDVAPNFKRAVIFKLLLEKPEGVTCGMFARKINGKDYAIASWNVDKSGYKRKGGKGVGPSFLKALNSVLSTRQDVPKNKCVLAGYWEIKTGMEMLGSNNTVVPYLTLVGQNDAATVTELLALA